MSYESVLHINTQHGVYADTPTVYLRCTILDADTPAWCVCILDVQCADCDQLYMRSAVVYGNMFV